MSDTNTMTYRGYRTSMTFDPDDKIIVGRVLDIADIIGFHGESLASLSRRFMKRSMITWTPAPSSTRRPTSRPRGG